MRILHVLSSNEYSGAENVACQIISMFGDNNEIEMLYCCPKGSIENTLKERGIKYISINRLCVKELKAVIQKNNIDIVHAHDMKASLVSALSCGSRTLISHIHNNAYASRVVSIKSVLYMLAAKKAKHIFWVSEEAKEGYFFKKVFEKKSSVLKNVVDIDEIKRLAETDKNEYCYDVIYVGRMEPEKDPERFVRVCEIIKYMKPNLKSAMIGAGTLEQKARDLCSSLELNETIDFLGYRKNPYKIMSCSKAVLMTSKWEGMPMVQLEAEALGTPVVRTPDTDEGLANKVMKCIKGEITLPENKNNLREFKKELEKAYGVVNT